MHNCRIAQLEQRAALRVGVRVAARGVARRLARGAGEVTAEPAETAEAGAELGAGITAVGVNMSEPMSGGNDQLSHRICPPFRGKMTRSRAQAS
jgi:hypothetical protein